jgi:hypothetical protein
VKDLILAPIVRQQLEHVTNTQPQVLIVQGVLGVGLYTIANSVAGNITKQHGIITISPDEKKNIKIDAIRSLYGHARIKHQDKLVIIIDDADAMQIPAQNALLKLLEETPESVYFILTTHHIEQLLPTVCSRAQEIDVVPVSTSESIKIIEDSGADNAAKAQLLFLAKGRPAEMARLMNDADYLTQRSQNMRIAKDFLSKSLYDKLILIYTAATERETALALLGDAINIVGVTLKKQPTELLASLLQKLLQTEEALHNDGHVRTQLLNLVVTI